MSKQKLMPIGQLARVALKHDLDSPINTSIEWIKISSVPLPGSSVYKYDTARLFISNDRLTQILLGKIMIGHVKYPSFTYDERSQSLILEIKFSQLEELLHLLTQAISVSGEVHFKSLIRHIEQTNQYPAKTSRWHKVISQSLEKYIKEKALHFSFMNARTLLNLGKLHLVNDEHQVVVEMKVWKLFHFMSEGDEETLNEINIYSS